MAIKTFGSAVYRVLENIQQSTVDMDSEHAHRARQFLMDAIEELHEEEFSFNQATGSFKTVSGTWEYRAGAKISKNVRRIRRVWYSDSASDDVLYPAHDEGLRQVDYNVIFEDVNQDADSTYDHLDAWAWFNEQLAVTPRPDGNIYIVFRYVEEPMAFSYTHDGSEWAYYKNPGTGDVQLNDLKIDAVRDSTGWLDNAFKLVVAIATRDLYAGPYQAKDPKKSLVASWTALVEKERANIEIKAQRQQGRKRTRPYYIPGD